MAKEKVDKSGKKITRREFLKGAYRGAQAAAYTAAGAAVGGFVGKGYEVGRDTYDKTFKALNNGVKATGDGLSHLQDKVEGMSPANPVRVSKKVEDQRVALYKRLFRRDKNDQASWNEKKDITTPKEIQPEYQPKDPNTPAAQGSEMTRRGFFKELLHIANKHPVATGATIGGGAGAYKANKAQQEGRYKDKVNQQGEQIEQMNQKVNALESRLAETERPASRTKKTLLLIGILGIFISILLSVTDLTGHSILQGDAKINTFGAVTFIISLIVVLISQKV
ncbi:hypothetical protein GOV14_01970 [Candidatus Pacearchaeota archaeon]|nr:hypothetical protein [Candidatus Pacearchaeota archaeon]